MKACEWVKGQKEFKLRINPDCMEFIIPRAVCADGFSISIQASRFHYCSPREDFADEYRSYELGYPSKDEPLLESYREKNVFPFVPADLVEQIVEEHGGIVL